MVIIIDDLLMGFVGIFKKIHEMAEEELYDPGKIKSLLAELSEAYEAGEIREEEFQELEAKLLRRLEVGGGRKKGGE